MKRIFLSLIMLAAIAVGVKAQGNFGVRVSYELACPGDVKLTKGLKADMFGNSSGFNVGVVYNMPVFFGFYFEPGVSIAYNTFSMNRALVDATLEQEVSAASVRMWDFRVPVIGGYKFNLLPGIGLSVFTGPELSLGMSAKAHYKFGTLSASESAYGGDGFMNRTDVKWRFGVGATFAGHLYGALSGAVGLCDRMEDDYSMKSNLFDITIGYNF